MKSSSVCIIGAGRVGAAAAFALALRGHRNIHIYDIDQKRSQGEAMDVCDAAGEAGAADSWDELKKANIYVVSAGKSRTADMTRQELYGFNAGVCEPIFRRIAELNPEAHAIVVTNPSDEIAELGKKYLKNIITSGGILDANRARIVFGRPVKIAGTHSRRELIGLRPAEKQIESRYHGRAAEIISLKGCTQWGVAAEVCALVEKIEKK